MDQICAEVTGFALGRRVFGGVMSRAIADYVVVNPSRDEVLPLPDVVEELIAATLAVAGRTALPH